MPLQDLQQGETFGMASGVTCVELNDPGAFFEVFSLPVVEDAHQLCNDAIYCLVHFGLHKGKRPRASLEAST